MTGATFDKSRTLPLFARVDEAGETIVLTFLNSAGAAYNISSLNFEIPVFKRPQSTTPQFTLSVGSGLTVGGAGSNELSIDLTAVRATQRPGTYFWRLYSDAEDHTWLNGPFYFHEGEFDGVNAPEAFTIDSTGTAVTIEVTTGITAATQSEVNTGTETAKYVSPATLQDSDDTAVALVDGATIDLTGPKHTLSTATSRTFTISHVGDGIVLEITLSATSATFTFPGAGTLCWFSGSGSGDNTLPVTGATSGDKIMIGIIKIGSNYRVTGVNFGQ